MTAFPAADQELLLGGGANPPLLSLIRLKEIKWKTSYNFHNVSAFSEGRLHKNVVKYTAFLCAREVLEKLKQKQQKYSSNILRMNLLINPIYCYTIQIKL